MNTARLILCVFVTLFGALPAFADARANLNPKGAKFSAPGGRARLQLDASLAKATVTHDKTSYVLDVGTDRGRNGDFYVSEDGRTVLFLRKGAFVGHVLDDPRGVGLKPEPMEGLTLWRDGKKLAQRSWEALLTRKQMFGQSVSHVHWILQEAVDWKKNELLLTTTSYRRYRLSLTDGKFLEEADLPSYVAAGRIAYGRVHRPSSSSETEELEVMRWEKGEGPTKLQVLRSDGAALDIDARWIVSKPVNGVATVSEYVDEVEALHRKQLTRLAGGTAPLYPTYLVVGAKAKLVNGEVEFRRAGDKDAYLHIAYQDFLPKKKKTYRALLVVPVDLPKKEGDPFTFSAGNGLLYEEGGNWSDTKLLVDAVPGTAGATVDGTVAYRSPMREDIVEMRLVGNPIGRVAVASSVGESLKQILLFPKVEHFRFVESK